MIHLELIFYIQTTKLVKYSSRIMYISINLFNLLNDNNKTFLSLSVYFKATEPLKIDDKIRTFINFLEII